MATRSDRDALTGARFVTLRHLHGLTQTSMARDLGVTQGFLSHVEKGTKPLPVDLAHAASDCYEVPVEFFMVGAHPSMTGVATFRKLSRASMRQEHAVLSRFDEAARLFHVASERSGYRAVEVWEARGDTVEETAENVRSMLGVGSDEPILNVTRALERLGVGVIHSIFCGSSDDFAHSGVSRPSRHNDRPLVATVGDLPPAVARLTLMHELAHLIYDRELAAPIRGTRAPQEQRAFRFAASMLVPEQVIRSRVTESLTLHGYLRVKADYGVSVGALIVRAADVGVITEHRKRSLFIQLSSQGWRQHEPVPVPEEKALLLGQAVRRGVGESAGEVARVTGVPESLAAQWADVPVVVPRLADVVPLTGRG